VTIELVVAGLLLAYLLIGLLLTIILWFDAGRPRWSIRSLVVAILCSPLAFVEYVLTKLLTLVAKH
jgi:hypothetical protein